MSMGDFSNFCGLLRISELYTTFYVNSGTYFLHFRDLCLGYLQFCKEWGGKIISSCKSSKNIAAYGACRYFFLQACHH